MKTCFIIFSFFFLKTCDLNDYPRAGGDLSGVFELKKTVNKQTTSVTIPNYNLRLESGQYFHLIKNNQDTLVYISNLMIISQNRKAYWTILGGQNIKTYEYVEFKLTTPLEGGKLSTRTRICSAIFRNKYDLKLDTLDYYFERR